MTLTHRTRHAVIAIGAAGALVVVGGGIAVASYSGISSTGQIHACWGNGGLRIVDHFPCRNGESPLSWNQKGVKGDAGPTGAAGTSSSGIAGVPGPTGATGATGAMGATGPVGSVGPRGVDGEQGIQGVEGVEGEQGIQGVQGDVGPAGAAAVARSSSPLYAYLSGCSMYGTVPNVPPTKGGQPAPTSGNVTQTAPGTYHLTGLTPGTSYNVSVCSVGSQAQTAASDGTVDVTIRGYDSVTGVQGAGFDGNGSPVHVSWYEGNVNKWAATLVLTAP